MTKFIGIRRLLDRCKNKRSNERDITLNPGDLEALIYRLREAEAGVVEAGQQLELCQQECHTVRRAYLHEKCVKETESNLAHMLLKALAIADHDEGTGGVQMAKRWMLQAIASLPGSPVMLTSTFAFSERYEDQATQNLRMLLDRHLVVSTSGA